MERLPLTSWHVRARVIVGAATFFDAFDVQAISVVLPVLAVQWHLRPSQIGFLISTGFLGQFAGALLFGWMGERFGRLRGLTYSVALLALMSLACAMARSYEALFIFRTIQGIAIGGEVPLAATYISELAAAHRRGRFFLLYEMLFGIGLAAAGLAGYWLVPRVGWQSMFVLGALPALLALVLRRLLPESPRWLAGRGLLEDANRVVEQMEDRVLRSGAPLAPVSFVPASAPNRSRARWTELFSRIYFPRTVTVWALWFTCYFVVYGLTSWLPTLYRTVFKLDVATALRLGLVTNLAGLTGDLLVALSIDRLGRRAWFTGAFALASLPLFTLWFAGAGNVRIVVVCASLSYTCVASNALTCYLYTPEIYPTRIRAIGTSIATAWLRAGSMAGPVLVAFLLTNFNLSAVFLAFALVSLAGCVAAGAFAMETRERVLEEISP